MGFYTTLDSDSDNAGEGFDDGDHVGITDDTMFSAVLAQATMFQAATPTAHSGCTSITQRAYPRSQRMALGSTEYEEEDYYASYWVGDDGVTTELGNSQSTWET